MQKLKALMLVFLVFAHSVQAKTAKEIYRDYKDSVLLVRTQVAGKTITGTAFAISSNGIFVTAAHVLPASEQAQLVNNENAALPIKAILWTDQENDLVVFKVASKQVFKPLPLASYQLSEVGENLSVISFPKAAMIGEQVGNESTLSVGLLSSIRQSFVSERKQDPAYDKTKPKVYDAKHFYDKLQSDCKLKSYDAQKKLSVLECSGERSVLVNQFGDILFDNLDLALRKADQVLYFANQNKAALEPQKTIGTMLQFTVPISPGSSGAPVFNELGEVIAIVNSYLQGAQNLNFGRPVDYLPKEYFANKRLASSFPKQ
jgi:S1-C subfamily serine protease